MSCGINLNALSFDEVLALFEETAKDLREHPGLRRG